MDDRIGREGRGGEGREGGEGVEGEYTPTHHRSPSTGSTYIYTGLCRVSIDMVRTQVRTVTEDWVRPSVFESSLVVVL
jgi:hypothetical protein